MEIDNEKRDLVVKNLKICAENFLNAFEKINNLEPPSAYFFSIFTHLGDLLRNGLIDEYDGFLFLAINQLRDSKPAKKWRDSDIDLMDEKKAQAFAELVITLSDAIQKISMSREEFEEFQADLDFIGLVPPPLKKLSWRSIFYLVVAAIVFLALIYIFLLKWG